MATFDELSRVVTAKQGSSTTRLYPGTIVAKCLVAEAAKGNNLATRKTLNLFVLLPPELQDTAKRGEHAKQESDLLILLDKYTRYKKLYGDLPPVEKKTPNLKNDIGEDQ